MFDAERMISNLDCVFGFYENGDLDSAETFFNAECRPSFGDMAKTEGEKADAIMEYFLRLDEILRGDQGTSATDVKEARDDAHKLPG